MVRPLYRNGVEDTKRERRFSAAPGIRGSKPFSFCAPGRSQLRPRLRAICRYPIRSDLAAFSYPHYVLMTKLRTGIPAAFARQGLQQATGTLAPAIALREEDK